MTVRTITQNVLDCDVCTETLENGNTTAVFDTPEAAVAYGTESDWTDLGNGRHACHRTNAAHDQARATAIQERGDRRA